MTAPVVDHVGLGSFEYAQPCHHPECGAPAVVFTTQSHSSDSGCLWSRGAFRCQKHFDQHRDYYAKWLKQVRGCKVCGGQVSGTLEQNMRVIPL